MQIRKALVATALMWLVALMTHTGAQQAPPPAAPAGAPQAPAPAGQPAGRGGPGQGRGGGRATFPAQQRPPGDPALDRARQDALRDQLPRLPWRRPARRRHGRPQPAAVAAGPERPERRADRAGRQERPSESGHAADAAAAAADDDIKAIAEYIHSVAATMRGQGSAAAGRGVELNIVVGDAAAGEAYFAAKCASLPLGDRRSRRASRARIASPLQLQNLWVSGAAAAAAAVRRRRRCPAPVTVTVTHAGRSKVEGRLVRIDDFIVIVG